ncbi:hypothetical protein Vretifemale_4801 [Volvox reticuliferus]|nr:hypothetical protein Vretifemale_4801 [Volvox reticuliferus]
MCNDCMTPTDSLVAPTSARSNGGHDNPQPIIISTVVFLISFCGYGPAIDVASFRSMWLNGPDTPPNTRTMQNTFDYCSQGKAIMNSSTQHIFDVPLQCTGKVPGTSTPYNYAQLDTICYTYSLHNMMLVAEDYVQKTLGIDISSIKQRIAVLPVDLSGYCDFGGMAGLGCTGTRCYSWINGLFAGNLYLYLHEMGHNLGLYHSRIPGRDYGDETCTMGNGRTCYNAPNMWRLGWVSPLPGGDLNDTTLPVGQPMIFYLPGQNENPHSYLRINPTWATTGSQTYSRLKAPIPAFFISHRYKEVPFDNLSPANSHIAVHTFSGTQDPQSYQNVTLEAFLFVKEEYRAPMPFNLVVRFVTYKSGGNATIIICRADGEEEGGGSSCSDGLDNDCDGLVDFADPDCAYVAPKPPSPRLPPSPRRSPPRPPASSPSQLQSPPSSPSQPQPPPSSPSQPQPPASPPDSPLPPSPPPLLPSPPGTPLHREPPFPPPPPSPRPPPFPRPPPRPPAFPRSPPRSPPPSLTPPTMTPSR